MRLSILVVDDEPSVCESLRLTLEDHYWVRTAGSVREALATLEQWHIDIALLDFKMPGMNGIDFLKRIAHTWPRLPVVMITATTDVGLALSMLQHGAVDYITKPFDVLHILQVIKGIADRRRFADQIVWQQRLRRHQDWWAALPQLAAWYGAQALPLPGLNVLLLAGASRWEREQVALQLFLDRFGGDHTNFYIEQAGDEACRAELLIDGLWLLDIQALGPVRMRERLQRWEAAGTLPAYVVLGIDQSDETMVDIFHWSRPMLLWELPPLDQRPEDARSLVSLLGIPQLPAGDAWLDRIRHFSELLLPEWPAVLTPEHWPQSALRQKVMESN